MHESFHLPDLKHPLALMMAALLAWAPLTVVPRAARAQIPEPNCVCSSCGASCNSGSHAPDCPYNNDGKGKDGSKSSGGGSLTRAPILVAPVGVAAGAVAGVVWWFKEMAGKYPGVSFFTSYHKFCTVEDDPSWASGAFSFGMHIGAAPWLVLYFVTGPVRAVIVALVRVIKRPSAPPKPKPPHPNIAVYELIARNYAALGDTTERELEKARGDVEAAQSRRNQMLDEHIAARPELVALRDREGVDAARARAEKQLDAWVKARAEKQKLALNLRQSIREKDEQCRAAMDKVNPLNSLLDSGLQDTRDDLGKALSDPKLSPGARASLTRELELTRRLQLARNAYDLGKDLLEIQESYEKAKDVGKDASEWVHERGARNSLLRLQLKLLKLPLSKAAGGVVDATEYALDIAYAAVAAVRLGRLIDADMATLEKLRTAAVFQDAAADDWARVNRSVKSAEVARDTIAARRDRYRKMQKENQAHADALR
ncbi:hypothetical protein KJ612_16760 [Myxococcota bacterium]|nr:hypothetical protein [Myxococcota bacterium]